MSDSVTSWTPVSSVLDKVKDTKERREQESGENKREGEGKRQRELKPFGRPSSQHFI